MTAASGRVPIDPANGPHPYVWHTVHGVVFRPAVKGLRQHFGSASISVQIMLIKRNHPGAEQFNAGAAVHGPLDCFQSIYLALGLPTAPGFQHRVSDSVEVLPRSSREALHGVDA